MFACDSVRMTREDGKSNSGDSRSEGSREEGRSKAFSGLSGEILA